jgi:hypothetical protein
MISMYPLEIDLPNGAVRAEVLILFANASDIRLFYTGSPFLPYLSLVSRLILLV